MKDTKRSWDILTKEEREKSIKEIVAYYLDERDESIDIIGADGLLDMFLQYIAPHVYNKALDDAGNIFKKQTESIDVELGILKK